MVCCWGGLIHAHHSAKLCAQTAANARKVHPHVALVAPYHLLPAAEVRILAIRALPLCAYF